MQRIQEKTTSIYLESRLGLKKFFAKYPIGSILLGIFSVACALFVIWKVYYWTALHVVSTQEVIAQKPGRIAPVLAPLPVQEMTAPTIRHQHLVIPGGKIILGGIILLFIAILFGLMMKRGYFSWMKVGISLQRTHRRRFIFAIIGVLGLNILLLLVVGPEKFLIILQTRQFWFYNACIGLYLFWRVEETPDGPLYRKWIGIAAVAGTLYFLILWVTGGSGFQNFHLFGSSPGSAQSTVALADHGDVQAAALGVGPLTKDVQYAKDKYFPDDPVMWSVAMYESSGHQFVLDNNGNEVVDAEGKKKVYCNPLEGSTACGLFQIIQRTSDEIGQQLYGMSAKDWENGGAASKGYDRMTLDGNCRSALYLRTHDGLAPWQSSYPGWEKVARLQFGPSVMDLTKIDSVTIFHGNPVIASSSNIRSAILQAPSAPDFSETYHMATTNFCTMVRQLEGKNYWVRIDHGTHHDPKKPQIETILGVEGSDWGEFDSMSFQSATGEDIPIIFLYRHRERGQDCATVAW